MACTNYSTSCWISIWNENRVRHVFDISKLSFNICQKTRGRRGMEGKARSIRYVESDIFRYIETFGMYATVVRTRWLNLTLSRLPPIPSTVAAAAITATDAAATAATAAIADAAVPLGPRTRRGRRGPPRLGGPHGGQVLQAPVQGVRSCRPLEVNIKKEVLTTWPSLDKWLIAHPNL